jgi:hypothetical protein
MDCLEGSFINDDIELSQAAAGTYIEFLKCLLLRCLSLMLFSGLQSVSYVDATDIDIHIFG